MTIIGRVNKLPLSFKYSPVPSGTVAQCFHHLDLWNTLEQLSILEMDSWHAGMMAQWLRQLNGTGKPQTSGTHSPICMDISHPLGMVTKVEHRPYPSTEIEPII